VAHRKIKTKFHLTFTINTRSCIKLFLLKENNYTILPKKHFNVRQF